MQADRERIDENVAISDIVTEFAQVFAFARSRWAKFAEEIHPELRGVGMMVLQVILRKEPVTATELGLMLGMDKALVSRQVTKLRDLGLIDATPSEEDRRVVLLTSSAQAQGLFEQLRHRNASEYGRRFAGWDDDELEALRAALHRFNSTTVDVPESPAHRCARHANEDGGGAPGAAAHPSDTDRATRIEPHD